jgi:hypothetical protein
MGSERDVVVVGDNIDILVGRMRNDIDLRIAEEKGGQNFAHGELHGGHRRRATHRAPRFMQPVAYGGLGQFRLAQHQHRVAVEFFAGIRHSEPP